MSRTRSETSNGGSTALMIVLLLAGGCGSNAAGGDDSADAHVTASDAATAITDGGAVVDASLGDPDAGASSPDASAGDPCSQCHGDTASPAPPEDLFGRTDTTLTGVGAHREHVATSTWHRVVACEDCHIVPATLLAPGHIDTALPAELTFGELANPTTALWDGNTCSGVYCHGTTLAGGAITIPVWTTVDGNQAQCDSCHGAPPPSHSPSATDCGQCHPTIEIGTGTFLAPARHIDGILDVSVGCDSCHGGSGNPAPPDDTLGNSVTTARGVGAHREHLGSSDWHRSVACGYCHVVPAAAGVPGHDDTAPPADMNFTDIGAGTNWNGTSCVSYCHGSTLAGGDTTPVWTVVDGVATECDACHGAPPPSHSPTSTDCGQCHATMEVGTGAFLEPARHIDGILDVVDGGACVVCHAVAIGGRRQIVGPGGDFENASHHVATAIESGDCEVCHDQAEHQGGTVRVKDADSPGTIITLTGDPEAVAAEAQKLEVFCLSCHDADGADGAPPFSDGVWPPVIDGAAWTASSHNGGALTCAGDGVSFGCHANAHASAKRMLLAPSDASQPPIAGDPLREQEGMCYGCHTAGGVASTNVQSTFALSTHHNVSAIDQADGSAVECTSCHNPHLAKATARLIDPDTGAAWESVDRTAFCLRCHDGTPPAGVAFAAAASGVTGSGYDKSAFIGSTHDSELGGGVTGWGCMHCHDEHGSSNRSTLYAAYQIADDTPYSSAAYALCFTCHTTSDVIFGDNAFEDLHDKHVRGSDAPCHMCHDAHREYDLGERGLIDLQIAIDGPYDLSFVGGAMTPSSVYFEEAADRWSCQLRCHGKQHGPKDYDPTKSPTDTTDPARCTACH